MMQADGLLRTIASMRMRAEALVLDLKAFELEIRSAVTTTRQPVGPVSDGVGTNPDCKCPAAYRVVISNLGEPGRTKCTKCHKEHEA